MSSLNSPLWRRRRVLASTLCIGVFALIALGSNRPTEASTCCVATNGNNAHSGTEQPPWLHPQYGWDDSAAAGFAVGAHEPLLADFIFGDGFDSWLSSWSNRVRITIDETKIDADLSDFPVLVHLSSSSGVSGVDLSYVFDALGSDANRKKIALTASNGTTLLYAEIEHWDTASHQAWIWTKVPSISSSVSTDIYLYYDPNHADNTARVGDTGSTTAQNVWDDGFRAVYHMNTVGSTVQDSTRNAHHGTWVGGATSPVMGMVGPSARFTGSNYIEVPDHDDFSLVETRHLIVSTWFSPSSLVMPTTDPAGQIRLLSKTASGQNEWTLNYYNDGTPRDQGIAWYMCNLGGGLCTGHYMWPYGDPRNNIAVDEWEHLTGRADEDSAVINGTSHTHWVSTYKNGDFRNGQSMDATATIVPGNGVTPFVMGHDLSWPDSWLMGRLDEVRVESAPRADAWIRASYHAQIDDLLVYASTPEP